MYKLNLIKKTIVKTTSEGFPFAETRWFVETNDGFDGTAQGHGFKTKKAVYKAYYYFKNKDKIMAKANEARKFLAENPDVRKILKKYMDADNIIYRIKCGEPTSIENLFEYLDEEDAEVKKKLMENEHLWRELIKHV
jgi:hypothetical protein